MTRVPVGKRATPKRALNRNRCPIGAYAGLSLLDAWWRAGLKDGLRVKAAVKRNGWRVAPAATSSQPTGPVRVDNLAALAEVQPPGRRAFPRRSKTAHKPAHKVPSGYGQAA
jgi:hypothetical protein